MRGPLHPHAPGTGIRDSIAMKLPLRLSALKPWTRLAWSAGILLVLFAALFDWNWLRGPLERYVSGKSGREVRIEHLDVSIGLTLEPTVRLRGVYVENAAWAAQQPMAAAGHASFTFALRSLSERRPVISRLVLEDADVDLERQADGLRNWRLLNPGDRGPGRIRVMTLEAHRSRVRFAHAGIDLEIVATASPPAAAATASQSGGALTNRITFSGRYRGEKFAGDALTGPLLTFRESGISFPLRGHAAAGKTRVDLDGTVTDMFDLAAMDATVRAAGPSLSRLHPFVEFKPAASRPYVFEARVTLEQQKYTVTRLHGRVGDTDLAGEATLTRDGERPRLRAQLRSASADLEDLAALAGATYRPPSGSAAKGRIFPAQAVSAGRMKLADAHIAMDIKKLTADRLPMLESLSFAAELENAVLRVKQFDLGMAGGHVVGSGTLNGQAEPPSSSIALEMRNVRLEKLFSALPEKARTAGPIKAQVKLAGSGGSVAAMLADATGTVAVVMDRGRVSNLLDAKLGLDGGKILGLLIRGDREIALNCAAVAIEFRKGVGRSHAFVIDTEETHADGTITVSLRDERFDLLLTPKPKDPGLFTLSASIRGEGSLNRPHFSVDKRVPLPRGETGRSAKVHALLRPLVPAGDSACAATLRAQPAARDTVAAKD